MGGVGLDGAMKQQTRRKLLCSTVQFVEYRLVPCTVTKRIPMATMNTNRNKIFLLGSHTLGLGQVFLGGKNKQGYLVAVQTLRMW